MAVQPNVCKVGLAEDVVIPGRHEAVVPGRLQDANPGWRGFVSTVIEPNSLKGRDFTQLVKTLCEELCISKSRTSAYHPEGDGMVERFNRTVCGILSMYVNDTHSDWDTRLQPALFAYRTSVHTSTGYTTFFLTYGEEARVPTDILWPVPRPQRPTSSSRYAQNVREELKLAYQRTRELLSTAHRRQKDVYDRKCHGEGFTVGDQRIQRVGGRQRVVVHFNRLKKYCMSEPEDQGEPGPETEVADTEVAEAGELQGEAVQAEEPETPQDWVQCNSCDSWRKITAREAAGLDPDAEWYC
ncbi:hypothetical protein Bbelb_020180 [Branchiostoma belcheri]|nr:hypothetical protein Bbelb_020180 [Branchiostoma belcheri]